MSSNKVDSKLVTAVFGMVTFAVLAVIRSGGGAAGAPRDEESLSSLDLEALSVRYHSKQARALEVCGSGGRVRHIPMPSLEANSNDLSRLGLRKGATWEDFKKEFSAILQVESSAKTVMLVRHGEGIHNVAERELGSEQWENVEAKKDKYFDASLNQEGINQCHALNKSFLSAQANSMPDIDVILVSPLSRAIQTAKHSLAHIWGKVPVYAVEMSRERFGKNKCDSRKDVSRLRKEFPEVNFELFMEAESDPWHKSTRETDKEIEKRIALFYDWLVGTPQEWRTMAIVGHSSFMAHSIQFLGAPYHWAKNCETVTMVINQT